MEYHSYGFYCHKISEGPLHILFAYFSKSLHSSWYILIIFQRLMWDGQERRSPLLIEYLQVTITYSIYKLHSQISTRNMHSTEIQKGGWNSYIVDLDEQTKLKCLRVRAPHEPRALAHGHQSTEVGCPSWSNEWEF